MNTPIDLKEGQEAPISAIMKQFNDLAFHVQAHLEAKREQITKGKLAATLAVLDGDQARLQRLDKTGAGDISAELVSIQLELDRISALRNSDDTARKAWIDEYITKAVAQLAKDIKAGKTVSPRDKLPYTAAAFVQGNYLPEGELSAPLARIGQSIEAAGQLELAIQQAQKLGLIPATMSLDRAKAEFMDSYSSAAAIHLDI